MLPFFKFWWDCVCEAWNHAWTTSGVIAAALALLVPFVIWIKPKWLTPMRQIAITDLIWQIPLTALLALFAVCFVLSPYWIYQRKSDELSKLLAQTVVKYSGGTSLTLFFYGNGQNPKALQQENVFRWFSLHNDFIVKAPDRKDEVYRVWNIFVVFEHDIDPAAWTLSVTSDCAEKLMFEVKDFGRRNALIALTRDIPVGVTVHITAEKPVVVPIMTTPPSSTPHKEVSPHSPTS